MLHLSSVHARSTRSRICQQCSSFESLSMSGNRYSPRLNDNPPFSRHLFAVAPVLNQQRSRAIFAEAKKYLPGGVDSPVRSFRGVGGDPVVVASASGARLTDVDGNVFIDYCGSWGPLILGHANGDVVAA